MGASSPRLAQGSVQLWHTNTTWAMASRPVSRQILRNMAISPDGRWLSFMDAHKNVPTFQSMLRFLRLKQGLLPLPDMGAIESRSEVADARLFSGISLAFSPDGRCVASGAFKTIEIRDRSTLQVVKTLQGFFALPQLLAFSQDGLLLAVGADQGASQFSTFVTGH